MQTRMIEYALFIFFVVISGCTWWYFGVFYITIEVYAEATIDEYVRFVARLANGICFTAHLLVEVDAKFAEGIFFVSRSSPAVKVIVNCLLVVGV